MVRSGLGIGDWGLGIALVAALSACNVPDPPASTGGVNVPEGPCGRGIVVASSGADFVSTNISLVSFDGEPLSESFLSSGATNAGSSAALSGDVVMPLVRPPSGKVVLIDRYNSTITWADPATARVEAQLSLSDGTPANPHDYVEMSTDRAYVSRFAAGDLWVIDPRTAQKLGTVSLPGERPCPDRMVRIGDTAVVLLQLFDALFKTAADGQLAGVRADAVQWTVTLAGLSNCGGMALSPSGARLAVACTGVFPDNQSTSPEQLAHSGIAVLDTSTSPIAEVARFAVAVELGEPVGWTLAFASEDTVVGRGVGDLATGRTDKAFALRLGSAEVQLLAEAQAYALGDVRCTPACGGACLMADAELGALRRWTADLQALGLRKIDNKTGLPPRFLGGF